MSKCDVVGADIVSASFKQRIDDAFKKAACVGVDTSEAQRLQRQYAEDKIYIEVNDGRCVDMHFEEA